MPSGDLKGKNLEYELEIKRVLEGGNLIGGEFVSGFESKLAAYLSTKCVISVASGMDALILSLTALDLPKSSNVLVVNNGGGYASLAVKSVGLVPVFSDIDPFGYLLDLNNLIDWNNRVSAIIVTHLYGKMVEMKPVLRWAKENNVKIIEDCAQAIGANEKGKMAG